MAATLQTQLPVFRKRDRRIGTIYFLFQNEMPTGDFGKSTLTQIFISGLQP
jgi:hypothetical protein